MSQWQSELLELDELAELAELDDDPDSEEDPELEEEPEAELELDSNNSRGTEENDLAILISRYPFQN